MQTQILRGGSGVTLEAMAAQAAADGTKVYVIDTDPKGYAASMASLKSANFDFGSTPGTIHINPFDLSDEINREEVLVLRAMPSSSPLRR